MCNEGVRLKSIPPERVEMLEGVQNLIHHRAQIEARRIGRTDYDADDLAQDAALRILTTATGWDETRAKATTYAALIVKGTASKEYGKAPHQCRDVRKTIAIDAGEIPLIDYVPDRSNDPNEADLARRRYERAKDALMPEEAAVIEMRYGIGGDCKRPHPNVIAGKLDITIARVYEIEAKALATLRQAMLDDLESDDDDDTVIETAETVPVPEPVPEVVPVVDNTPPAHKLLACVYKWLWSWAYRAVYRFEFLRLSAEEWF